MARRASRSYTILHRRIRARRSVATYIELPMQSAAKGVPASASPVVEGQNADPRGSPRLTRGRRKPAGVEYGESSRDEAQPGGTPNECAAALKFARVKRSARRSVGSREEIHLNRLRHGAGA